MSEHARSSAAKVIPLPEPEYCWPPPEMLDEWIAHGRMVKAYVPNLGIDGLLQAQRKGFELLALAWQGLPPGKAEEFIETLAPSWAELMDLIEHSRARGKALLAKRGINV